MFYILILSHVSPNVGGVRQRWWESGRWACVDSRPESQIVKDTKYAVQKPRSCGAKFRLPSCLQDTKLWAWGLGDIISCYDIAL